jgi:hypothetical protein
MSLNSTHSYCTGYHYVKSPAATHTPAAICVSEMVDHCTRDVRDDGFWNVTPEGVSVICPVPAWMIVSIAPTLNAVAASTVNVQAPLL